MNKHMLVLFAAIALAACTHNQSNETSMKNEYKVADYTTDPQIERHTRDFLKALNSGGGKPMEQLTPADARKVLEGAQMSVTVDVSGIDITEKIISAGGLPIKIYIVRPAGITTTLPACMFFHGGGWMLGDFATHKRFIRDLVVYSGTACVFVEYSRSPEVKYPVALNECYAATKWIAEHGAELNVDGKRLAVAGNSAGGNLAAAVCLMSKDKKGPAIQLQVLFWPVTDANVETDSYNRYATHRFLTKNMMIWFWDNYTDKEQRKDIYASPLQATPDQLKGLPPALVQTAENDVLLDEGEAYGRKMDEAGVNVTLVRIQGMIHDYGLLNPLANAPAVQSALREAATEIKVALQ